MRRRLVLAGAAVVAVLVAGAIAIGVRGGGGAGGGPAAGGSSGGGSAAVRAPAGPALPDSGLRLAGTVVDGAGAAVVGAQVAAELEAVRDPALAGSGSGSGSGSAALAPIAPTATDAAGGFELAIPIAGRYRIRVAGVGLLPAELRFVPAPSAAHRIVVARQVSITGRVLDGGAPLADATVGLRGEALGGGLTATTDATGAFAFDGLPEGRYHIHAYRGALAARAQRLTRLGAGPFEPVELVVEAATVVVGRVIDRDEGTGLRAAIELRPSGDDELPRFARSEADGTFRIDGVPRGTWIADAWAPGFLATGGVELEAGRGVAELALLRGAAIEGRVLDGEGRPVANASVRAAAPAADHAAAIDRDQLRRFSGYLATAVAAPGAAGTAGGSSPDPQLLARGELGVMVGPIPPIPPPGSPIAQPAVVLDPAIAARLGEPLAFPADPARDSLWVTGSDGRYRIRGLPRGAITALAVAPGFAEARSRGVAVELGEVVTGVDIVLAAGTILVGTVRDQHGAPVSGAQVTATPSLGAPVVAFTDAGGGYQLSPLIGAVELVATAQGHAGARRTLDLAPAPGRDPVTRREDLALVVADAVLIGTLDDATGASVAGATLEVIDGAAAGRTAVVGADGTFELAQLPAGALVLRVRHPDYPPTELATTPGPAHVRLRLPIGGAVEGAVVDGDSGAPLAATALTATGPGGATADTRAGADGRWRLGPLRPGRWRLTVRRAGYLAFARELDVTAARQPGEASVRDVRIDLARGALVAGIVRDSRGARIAGARISVQRADGSGPEVEGATDRSGEFRLRDVPIGDVAVSASRGGATGSTRVTLRGGDEVLGLALEIR